MVIKPKALKFNCKKVIMTLKVSYGVEKSIGKPITLSHGMEWIANGNSIVPIEKSIKNKV